MIRSICPTRGCYRRVAGGGKCGPHQLEDDQRRHDRQREQGRDTAYWEQLRADRLALAGGRCELRLAGCTGAATSVHLDETLKGDHLAATIDDVLAACATCHGTIDAPRATGGGSLRTRGLPRPAPAFRAFRSLTVTQSGNGG